VGTALNSKTLGERKNCNLPGVLVELPVLGEKDADDVQNFACKHGMDLIAVSFVQSADDVRFVRKTLDAAGGNGEARGWGPAALPLVCPPFMLAANRSPPRSHPSRHPSPSTHPIPPPRYQDHLQD
jgi:hypothetical protein